MREHSALGVLLSGGTVPATWGAPEPPKADVFGVKGILEALGEALGVELRCETADRRPQGSRIGPQTFLHPGRAATVLCEGEELGWLGELHPLVAREWGIDGAAAMELDLDALLARAGGRGVYRDVVSFPALRQDLAVVLPEDVEAAQVLDAVRAAGAPLLDEASVFDVYSGPQVDEGRRSLALSLSFRAPDRTLTDEDVAPVRSAIMAALGKLGGELRA